MSSRFTRQGINFFRAPVQLWANAAITENDDPSHLTTLISSTDLTVFPEKTNHYLPISCRSVHIPNVYFLLFHKSLTSKYTSTWLVPQGMELPEEKQPGHHKRFERVAFKLILESNLSLEFTLP